MPSVSPLTEAQIDRFILALRSRPGDHICRGRVGVGYAFRDGRFVRIELDEADSSERFFDGEEALRAYLRSLPLSQFVGTYDVGVMKALGAL